MNLFIKSSIVTIALFSASIAQAASGISTATINLRTGPGVQYPSVGKIPNGAGINIAGCTSSYGWCRVNYRGYQGWASSRYIAAQMGNSRYTNNDNFGATAAAIGIPLIAGLAISSAIGGNRWDRGPNWESRPWGYRPYGRDWGPRPSAPPIGWGVRPNRAGWNGPGHWGPPRPHWGDNPGWRNHPGYHPNFYGPGNRWRPNGWR